MKIDKRALDSRVSVGRLARFNLRYTNLGTVAATGIVLREIVPFGSAFDASSSTPGWTCPSGTSAGDICMFSVGSLPSRSSGNVQFSVKVVARPRHGNNLWNFAFVQDDGAHGQDVRPYNNVDWAAVRVRDGGHRQEVDEFDD